MIRIAQQVSRAIRILRGNRDESARASHLVVNNDRSAEKQSLQVNQAEREKFFQSTFFERKIMSTKTAFKRLALVAAAALAIGGVSAVSAQASAPDWTISNSSGTVGQATSAETATQIAGPGNFVTLTNAYAGSVYFTVTGGATTTGTTSGTVAEVTVAGTGVISIATPTVGTVTVSSYDITGGTAAASATSTVTISVVAALPGTLYGASTVYANSGLTVGTSTTDANFSVSQPAGTASVANFDVNEQDASGNALTSGFVAVTATSTNGLLTSTGGITTASGTTYISGTPTTNHVNFVLSGLANVSGTSTVTISVNGVVAKTYSVTFTGTASKIVLKAINPVIAVGSATAELAAGITANTEALEVQEFDANGNAIAVTPANITITPAASTIATAGSLSQSALDTLGHIQGGTVLSTTVTGVSLNGVAAGTTTFTATDSATVAGTTLTSAPVSVRVSSASPTTVVLSTDASAYAAGGLGTLTTTISDAAGTVPAGVYAVFTGQASSSYALTVGTSSLPGGAVALVTAGASGSGTLGAAAVPAGSVTVNDSGVATDTFNAPISDATGVTISATAAATTITVTPATFDVTSGASDAANAATDAANEATDAANAATDAANAAADSADAATQAAQDAGDKADAALAAVTALSQQVTTLLAKVAAVSAALAKISAAIAKLPKK